MRKKAPNDPGLQLIDNYTRAIIQTHVDRFAGHTPEVIEQERATVTALAVTIRERMTADYLSNQRRQP
jgi:hypothetical protein